MAANTEPEESRVTSVRERSQSAEAAATALRDVKREPGAKKPDPILIADNVSRRFGGLTAVNVEHVEIQRGIITALIGPNGAGKTTFFNLLTGFDKPNTGAWSFKDKPLKGVSAYKVARRGMVRTFQLTKVLAKLTVIENMRLGATGQKGERFLPGMLGLWKGQEKANTEKAAPCSRCCGATRRRASRRRQTRCWRGSCSMPSGRTSPALSPGGSESCSRWHGP